MMNADGSGAHEIDDSSRGYAFMPEWSQDGTKIAFTRIGYVSGTPSPDLTYADLVSAVVVDESGRELTSVPSGFLPHWSPDSTRISFLANFAAHDYGNFWLADPSILTLASGAITTVTTQIRALDSPRWSPDGSMLAYFGQTEGVYVAAGDGGAPSRIFGGQSNTGYAALSWIDDGALVMSEISDVEGTPKYVVIDVAGGATTELSADGVFGCIGRDIAPGDGQEFSVANGQEFVWSLPCAKPPGIREVSNAASFPSHDMTTPIALSRLSVSPDGERMVGSEGGSVLYLGSTPPSAINSPSGVWIIKLNSGATEKIGNIGRDPAWRP